MNRSTAYRAAAALVLAVAAFIGGRALRPESTESFSFDSAAVYNTASDLEGVSQAGFSGFGEADGLNGSTVIAGKVSAVSNTSITLQGSAGDVVVQVSGNGPLHRLESTSRDQLRPGVSVVVRLTSSGEAEAVLIVER